MIWHWFLSLDNVSLTAGFCAWELGTVIPPLEFFGSQIMSFGGAILLDTENGKKWADLDKMKNFLRMGNLKQKFSTEKIKEKK